MSDQPRMRPLRPSTFFPDGSSARPPVDGTVARGHLDEDDAFFTGRVDGKLVERIPVPITAELVRRGQERFTIYCTPCHGQIGDGTGMIVQRGFPQPPTYHQPRLRQAPDGHFFEMITKGQGKMQPYAAQVPPADRWAIVAYIRALQLSQNATLADLPAAERQLLEQQPLEARP